MFRPRLNSCLFKNAQKIFVNGSFGPIANIVKTQPALNKDPETLWTDYKANSKSPKNLNILTKILLSIIFIKKRKSEEEETKEPEKNDHLDNDLKCEDQSVEGNVGSKDIEKNLIILILAAERNIIEGNTEVAKSNLYEALQLSEKSQTFSSIATIYDLLATIAFREGSVPEAEDMLVRFIEKLIGLGYPETHNSIVRFKLKLSRLYHIIGNREMAEIGFRNCIDTQEEKLTKDKNDELTNLIYISSLFWYGRFLTENNELDKASSVLKKTLTYIDRSNTITPSQLMVVLYHNAEVAFKLHEYDDSIDYLIRAIKICKEYDELNPDFPIYLVKLGVVYLFKGVYDKAGFWCSHANRMAVSYNNEEAEEESNLCLKRLEEIYAEKRKR